MAPLIIAHRTCPLEAPENSLAGIDVAARDGADGVEIDLRMSLDQHPFLMHDWTLQRMTGFALPIELTPSSKVHTLRLQGGVERVPDLNEVFERLAPGLRLAVDVKAPWAIVPLVQQIRRRGLEQRVLVWCTSAVAVRYAVGRLPSCEVAYLKDVLDPLGKQLFIEQAVGLDAKAISAHWQAIDTEFVASAHGRGLRVYAYHQRFELTESKLRAGLDGIITDYPVEARAAVVALALGNP